MEDNTFSIHANNAAETLSGQNQMLMDMITAINMVSKCGYVITEYEMSCTVIKKEGDESTSSEVTMNGEPLDFTGGFREQQEEEESSPKEDLIRYLEAWSPQNINGGYDADRFRIFLTNVKDFLVQIYGKAMLSRIMGGYNLTVDAIMQFDVSGMYQYFNDVFLLMLLPYHIIHNALDKYELKKEDM